MMGTNPTSKLNKALWAKFESRWLLSVYSGPNRKVAQKLHSKNMFCLQVWREWSLPTFLFSWKAFWGKLYSLENTKWLNTQCSIYSRKTLTRWKEKWWGTRSLRSRSPTAKCSHQGLQGFTRSRCTTDAGLEPVHNFLDIFLKLCL